jgi:microcystin-dependent protein
MAKTKISEFSATSADNTDITNINIAEGCSPSNVNNAIRSLMSLLKNQQDGSSGDPFTVAGTLVSSGTVDITGAFRLDGTAGASGQVLLSAGGSNTPTWGNIFVAGMIMLWSGSSASIPSGWLLCDGSSSTPDLRNRFVVGAGSTYAVNATGGSADATLVSHSHTTNSTGAHVHTINTSSLYSTGDTAPNTNINFLTGSRDGPVYNANAELNNQNYINSAGDHAHTISTEGSSATNANLPPYYALCYIMKA